MPLIVRVHRHAAVPEHRLRPGGGDRHLPPFLDLVGDVVQVPLYVLVLHLDVGEGGLAARAPVDHVVSAVDQPLVVQLDERLVHGAGEPLVQGESLARPVARTAQCLQLFDDLRAVLLLPLPHAGNERLAPDVVARQAVLCQHLLHHVLGGDTGVVRPGEPARVVPVHPLVADDDVLQGVVQGVPHVQPPGHVGRRNDDGERPLARSFYVSAEEVPLLPEAVYLLLHL